MFWCFFCEDKLKYPLLFQCLENKNNVLVIASWSVTRLRLWTAWRSKGWIRWSHSRCKGMASQNSWMEPFWTEQHWRTVSVVVTFGVVFISSWNVIILKGDVERLYTHSDVSFCPNNLFYWITVLIVADRNSRDPNLHSFQSCYTVLFPPLLSQWAGTQQLNGG